MTFCSSFGCHVDDVSQCLFYPAASSTIDNATQMTIRALESSSLSRDSFFAVVFDRRVDDMGT
jgi:hypothetical protein